MMKNEQYKKTDDEAASYPQNQSQNLLNRTEMGTFTTKN